MIKNLSQLKKELVPGARFEIIKHTRHECVGQTREINIANTQGFYSIIPGEPGHRISLANCGKGSWLAWSKAPYWEFEDNAATLYDSTEEHTEEHLIMEIKIGGAV